MYAENYENKDFFLFCKQLVIFIPLSCSFDKKKKSQKIKEKSDVETSALILSQNFRPIRYLTNTYLELSNFFYLILKSNYLIKQHVLHHRQPSYVKIAKMIFQNEKKRYIR